VGDGWDFDAFDVRPPFDACIPEDLSHRSDVTPHYVEIDQQSGASNSRTA
jgi:hypothetical protein